MTFEHRASGVRCRRQVSGDLPPRSTDACLPFGLWRLTEALAGSHPSERSTFRRARSGALRQRQVSTAAHLRQSDGTRNERGCVQRAAGGLASRTAYGFDAGKRIKGNDKAACSGERKTLLLHGIVPPPTFRIATAGFPASRACSVKLATSRKRNAATGTALSGPGLSPRPPGDEQTCINSDRRVPGLCRDREAMQSGNDEG